MPKTLTNAGQFNLRGKKTKAVSCGCCVVTDLRESYNLKRIEREDMKNYGDDTVYPEDLIEWSTDNIDTGTWEVTSGTDGTVVLTSTDFTYDAVLHITGDFGSMESKLEYARNLARRLNYEALEY